MGYWNFRSLLFAAIFLSTFISWAASKHHYKHNVLGHRSRHRRQGAGLFLSSSYVIPGGEGQGAWGEWGEVSPCSRTCGGGVASQKRICLQVDPDGRSYCTGGDTKFFSCQTQDCPEGSQDFRSEQCSKLDDEPFRGVKHKWVPYTKGPNPCELNCMPRGDRFYRPVAKKVIDGTRCNEDSFDVCVDGTCQHVGCDMMLGSSAREDKCRECRGNGTNCRTNTGVIDTQDLIQGYNDVLIIPEGATSIIIAEKKPSSNYLSLRSKATNTYYLNGDYIIDFPRTLTIAGATWRYERNTKLYRGLLAPDVLRCLGPINETLYLSLLLQDTNVGIDYEYSIPTAKAPPPNQEYIWAHDEFSPCSATCGGGIKTRRVACRSREELDEVDERLCDSNMKPATNQTCGTRACDARWVEGPWSTCSKPCGQGGTKSREVHCEKIIANGLPSIVNDDECLALLGEKPRLFANCEKKAACPTWFTGPWKPCNKLCDEGKQTRTVVCHQRVEGRVEVLSDGECDETKPPAEQTCLLRLCEPVDYMYSDWTGCDTCNSKVRTRVANCVTNSSRIVNASLCAHHPTPIVQEDCNPEDLPECSVQWYATQWSNCSVECGKGNQTRKVFCGEFNGEGVTKVDDSKCNQEERYKDTKPCEIPADKCPAKWFAGLWSECSKLCGGGERKRKVMCLSGGKPSANCDENTILEDFQSCNEKPCDKDQMLPVDAKSTPIMDDDEDYDDCDEDDTIDETSEGTTAMDIMLSDSPSTTDEGSGFGLTTATDNESEFTTEGSGTEETEFDTTETITTEVTSSTDTSETDNTVNGTTMVENTTPIGTDLTETTSSVTESSETKLTGSTDSVTESTNVTETENTTPTGTETGDTVTVSTDATETESTTSTGTYSTETTDTVTESTNVTETENTTPTGTETEDTVTVSTDATETESTTFTGTYSTETTDTVTESTDETETTDTVTVTTDITETEITTSTETEPTGTTDNVTDTENTTPTGTETTDDVTETENTTPTGTETTVTTDSVTESTEAESTTSSGTESTGTTISITETTDVSEAENTTSTGTEQTGTTDSTETTEVFETENTASTESGSTETVTTESTDTSDFNSTEIVTTEIDTEGSTTTSETAESTTESNFTSETSTTEELSTTESTTESGLTEKTETDITSSTETDITEESTTPWDWATTIELITKKMKCRPRKTKCGSAFGCCPDKKSPAKGPFDEGCPEIPKTCEQTEYGCCPDGVSPAGKNKKGCPIPPCNETLYGCCKSDKVTPAEGNNQEGCPPPPPACKSTKYGCCKDEKTKAKGPKGKGCPENEPKKVSKGCADSEFGCCYDNKTQATGPDGEGCPCAITEFKCCPDNVTTALGPHMEGCVLSCNTSAYGCCPDNETPAHGPEQEGCCLQYSYGCCPDNYTPAQGPQLQGCTGCQYAHFGCCPDNATIARGPGYQGCGCQHSQHGCCPDRVTEASGPDFEGCPCHTFQFGCCADGTSHATGPNQQGCLCRYSKFGCCGDELTAATGPNKEGCDCSNSKYGCCPDGQTEAQGEKFLGCTDLPENRQAACSLRTERGTCHNYTVFWFYDKEYGGCSRFWYGGCGGNGNRFVSNEECQDVCVQPQPKDACKLPKVHGACTSYLLKWYFDSEREQCSQFVYGGCLGNANNFETRELCQSQCEPARDADVCKSTIERGPCAGSYRRWGFNAESGSCEQFVWGGCGGNSNRFSTEAACVQRCDPPGALQPQCSEPQDAGNCTSKQATWSFSLTENRCVPFYYTGCGGNGNRFTIEEECTQTCPSIPVKDACILPAEVGDCANYREKWYYDTSIKRCRQFYYGGCGGNGNNFNTEQECENRCSEQALTTTTQLPAPTENAGHDYCFLEKDPGPCNMMEIRYAYDSALGRCVQFQYGGCGGNRNNFPDLEYCNHYCAPIQDVCQLPMRSGPCGASLMRWFYDASSDSCSQFTYGGCEGNENQFESREACEQRCRSAPAPTPATPPPTTVSTIVTTTTEAVEDVPAECRVPGSLEPCTSSGRVWYLDVASRRCRPHDNPGSGDRCRNTGVFPSEEFCERSCGTFRNLEVCRYQLDPGTCQGSISKYYFNETSRTCEEFTYTGCNGSPNRFSSIYECEEVCKPDPCQMQQEPGNCLAAIAMWYYDAASDQCGQFYYSGCQGNENRFNTREECEGKCKKNLPPPAPTAITPTPSNQEQPLSYECRTPDSLIPCGANVTVFYYDAELRTCVESQIGGCRYPNSYRTEEECERKCGAFRGLDVCAAPVDAGPCREQKLKFYFEQASGRCLQFGYGGCHGGPNRFSSEEECEEVCGDAGPEEACLVAVSRGAACGKAGGGAGAGLRRWYYSVDDVECRSFIYEGCGGNSNNFASYQECVDRCVPVVNEIPPEDCSSLQLECDSIRCEHSVQRTRTAGGCEKCSCVPVDVDCTLYTQECDALICTIGMNRTRGDDGCERCRCLTHPCDGILCPSGELCVATPRLEDNTQQVVYDVDCKAVTPPEDCSRLQQECDSIRCEYSVQRTRTAGGCEKCSCVPVDVDCTLLSQECDALICTFGLNRTRGDDGCERCQCLKHPCENTQCPSGERCVATPVLDDNTQQVTYNADCKIVNKPGRCPADSSEPSPGGGCRRECNDDADCAGAGKCCTRGCSQRCRDPAQPSTAPPSTTGYAPELPQAPQANVERTEPAVSYSEGGKASLRCFFHGNPPPTVTWRRGEITIDGDVGRYRILSDGTLEIVSLYRNDSGVYICVADNGLGTAKQEVHLQVTDPEYREVGIAGDDNASKTGDLGAPLSLRCLAYGYPEPTINWYHGPNGGVMVPFESSLYEIRRDGNLLIKTLNLETLGEYSCQAYNGQGKAASWSVVVRAWAPAGYYIDNQYVILREVQVTPRPHTTELTTPTTTTTQLPIFTVPVNTSIEFSGGPVSAGSTLSLPCEVDGYPAPTVTWTKDGAPLAASERITLTAARLTISNVTSEDSGRYGCHASNQYSRADSIVDVQVRGIYIPSMCTDNPFFANCHLIVKSNYCTHSYYSKFCCKSCVEAGQLQPEQLRFDDSWQYRRK